MWPLFSLPFLSIYCSVLLVSRFPRMTPHAIWHMGVRSRGGGFSPVAAPTASFHTSGIHIMPVGFLCDSFRGRFSRPLDLLCFPARKAHHVKAGGVYDDVLNGLGVGSACRGDTRGGRLLAGFTATPRRFWRSDLIGRKIHSSSLMHVFGYETTKTFGLRSVFPGVGGVPFSAPRRMLFSLKLALIPQAPRTIHRLHVLSIFCLTIKHPEVHHV